MRKWRPIDVPADDEWAVKHQNVVPSSYGPHILSLAHDTPMSGHLGGDESAGLELKVICYNSVLTCYGSGKII